MVRWFEEPYALIETPIGKLAPGQERDVVNETSSEMAMAHNMFLRTINAIWVQAPHVKPADQHAFLSYASCLFSTILVHHHTEEKVFFPAVEKMAGAPGLMEDNVSQHHLFYDSMSRLSGYISGCIAGEEAYDAARLRGLVDDFGPVLRRHLADEIVTLEKLRERGLDTWKELPQILKDDAAASVNQIGLLSGIPAMFHAIDKSYENGIWREHRPLPWALEWTIRNVFALRHSDWWRFAPCTVEGEPKPHPYARPETA